MEKTLKRTLLWFGAGLLLLLVVTVINQVYQISVTSSAIRLPRFSLRQLSRRMVCWMAFLF